ncbi:hypothetical protein BC2926_55540 [Bacillus cereus]|nr:hypothetical protein BC2926_55540 [Bacillus cereus]
MGYFSNSLLVLFILIVCSCLILSENSNKIITKPIKDAENND